VTGDGLKVTQNGRSKLPFARKTEVIGKPNSSPTGKVIPTTVVLLGK
jgi:hypothetical protein